MYYSKQVYSPTRKIKKILQRLLQVTWTALQQWVSLYTPKLQWAFLRIRSTSSTHRLATLKTSFTVLTLLVFSYAMIYADNFQWYDQFVLAHGSWLDEQSVKTDNSLTIDLESIVIDESDDLGVRKITYTVRKWDTPWQIAKQFGITTKNLLLVNDLNTNAPLKVGTKLLITPVEWFVIQNTAGDMSVEQFARKHLMDVDDLRELNDYSSNLDIIKNGYDIFIPLTEEEGIRLGMIQPESEWEPVINKPSWSNPSKNTTPSKNTAWSSNKPTTNKPIKKPTLAKTLTETKKVGKAYYSRSETSSLYGFAAGNCTAYVAHKKPAIAKAIRAEWWWHAKKWYAQAINAWLSVSKKPSVWSVWVLGTTYGYYGHVWVVSSVSDDEVCMNNANVRGRWVVSQDCFPRSSFIGFIKW